MKLYKKILLKLNFGKTAKSVSWILLQQIYTAILSLIFSVIVARVYGPEKYGIVTFCQSYISIFSFIAIFGTDQIMIKDFVENKYNKGTILGSALFLRIILSFFTLIVNQTISLILYNKEINIIILIFNINTILCCCDIITYFAQSQMENKYISISKIISNTVFALAKALVLLLKLDIKFYAITFIIETLIYLLLLIYSYFKLINKEIIHWHVDKMYILYLLKKGKYYALSTLMVTIYLRIDQVMLGTIFNEKSLVGVYSVAVRISEIWTFVPLALITSMKPSVIRCKFDSYSRYISKLKELYNVVSFVCFIFVVCIFLFGKFGINILFGREYSDAYLPLLILSIGIWIGVLGNIHYVWMTCEGKEKYSIFYSLCGSVINVVFNILLIPKYNLVGAAIATLISQICSNIISFLFLKSTRILSYSLVKSLNPINGFKMVFNMNLLKSRRGKDNHEK